jgi:DNA-binding NarL/FixJ family response regulator
LICDDHLLFAEAFAYVIEASGHDVVGCVVTPEAAADIAREQAPDVCFLDLTFRCDVRVDGVAMVKEASPSTCIVVLSGYVDPGIEARVRDAGATHCLSKATDMAALAREIGRLFTPQSTASIPWGRRGDNRWDAHPHARFLTQRERAVLQGLVDGESTARLASHLAMREATVRTHVQNVLGKLGAHSRVEAVAAALADGLASPAAAFDDRGYGSALGASGVRDDLM